MVLNRYEMKIRNEFGQSNQILGPYISICCKCNYFHAICAESIKTVTCVRLWQRQSIWHQA